MRQAQHHLAVETRGKGLTEITPAVARWQASQGIRNGLLTLFCRHTSASLIIQENADPDVRTDLEAFFERLAPESEPYVHTLEGPDDMPAHIRAALTQASLTIPVSDGRHGARHLAGHLSVRASAAAASQGCGVAPDRGLDCSRF